MRRPRLPPTEPLMPHPLLDLWSTILGLPNLGVYLWIGWACYLLGLGGWIILQKREPAATLSWLISLACGRSATSKSRR